jgi:hypothetical protein
MPAGRITAVLPVAASTLDDDRRAPGAYFALLWDDGKHAERLSWFSLPGGRHRQANGLHRGWTFPFNRGSGKVAYDPPVVIETPTAFRSAHAAAIEASVYIREVIRNGTNYTILPPGERRSIPASRRMPINLHGRPPQRVSFGARRKAVSATVFWGN